MFAKVIQSVFEWPLKDWSVWKIRKNKNFHIKFSDIENKSINYISRINNKIIENLKKHLITGERVEDEGRRLRNIMRLAGRPWKRPVRKGKVTFAFKCQNFPITSASHRACVSTFRARFTFTVYALVDVRTAPAKIKAAWLG